MKLTKHRTESRASPLLPSTHGHSPPHAVDFEEVILGSVILESNESKVKTVLQKAQPYHFYKKSHQRVCFALKTLLKQGLPIDILTVTEQVRKNGDLDDIGGPLFITQLTNRVAGSTNIEYWFRIVYQKFLQREIIRIGYEKADLALNNNTDVFELLEDFIAELEKFDPVLVEAKPTTADRLAEEMMEELNNVLDNKPMNESQSTIVYKVGWTRFDKMIALGRDRIVLLAGAASSGKSRFIRAIMYRLLEKYADISICWITLEDSRQDLLRSYLASKVYITAKHLKSRQYEHSKIDQLKEHTLIFQSFDIEFIDQAIKSDDIVSRFIQFCDRRKGRFNILVVDNLLSLDDQGEFRFDPNGFCNHVMHNLLKCRQKTKGLIIPLHHFNDAQQDKENLKTGYRPVLKDMKGSETFRRTPNQVLLINSFNIYKDLMSEYSGDEHRILEHLFIVDTGKNREDKINDSAALIHFFTEMAYDQFWEIPFPESEK